MAKFTIEVSARKSPSVDGEWFDPEDLVDFLNEHFTVEDNVDYGLDSYNKDSPQLIREFKLVENDSANDSTVKAIEEIRDEAQGSRGRYYELYGSAIKDSLMPLVAILEITYPNHPELVEEFIKPFSRG